MSLYVPAYAQTPVTYEPLEPLPGVDQSGSAESLQGFLIYIYRVLFTIGGMIAAVSFVVCGVIIMFSEVAGKRKEAKNRVWAVFWGLIIFLIAWLILYTINPNLLDFNFRLDTTNIRAPDPEQNPQTSVRTLNNGQMTSALKYYAETTGWHGGLFGSWGYAVLGGISYPTANFATQEVGLAIAKLQRECNTPDYEKAGWILAGTAGVTYITPGGLKLYTTGIGSLLAGLSGLISKVQSATATIERLPGSAAGLPQGQTVLACVAYAR